MSPGNTHVPNDCQMPREVLARLGDKWSVLVVILLGQGPRRFNDIKRTIGGISQRMLSLTLRGLERDGMVTRTVLPTVPPGVDYALTEMGRSLWQPIESLGRWARENGAAIMAARAQFDASRAENQGTGAAPRPFDPPPTARTPGFPAPAPQPRAAPRA